jgi:hypothetical protein
MTTVASAADTTTIDIPFLIRGRVIEPGDDALEFGGRLGARFRTPDAERYADQLVLADAGALRDLHDTPVSEIIEFLVELGPRLALEENRLMQAAYHLALDAGDLTESILRRVYDDFLSMFDGTKMAGNVEKGLGSSAFLDGWVELGAPGHSSKRVRAIGTRQLHIIAGNVPVVAASTVIQAALSKGDCLIKMPSNDPFTAAAIVQSMIELDPNHPVTKHFSVAYWKGGSETVERQIIRPSRIEKLIAWGGMASMKHIQRYLVPGIELIAYNPKWSIAIVGHETLETDEAMREAAFGVAYQAGIMNQTGCNNTRVVYAECTTDEDDLERLERFGHAIYDALGKLSPSISTAPKRSDPNLDAELRAIELEDEYYRVIGDSSYGGAIVSRTEDRVEFSDQLNNRIVNVVPIEDISRVAQWVNESTQTVGVYPQRLREELRDELALHGVQRVIPLLGESAVDPERGLWQHDPPGADPSQHYGNPHDGIQYARRMVRWVTDESTDLH